MHIILTVDGSEHAQAAIGLLKSLPLSTRSTITALAVANAPQTPNHFMLVQALEQACDQLKSTNLEIKSQLLHGHPAHEIVRFADESKPELIIMGAKGLRATMGILLGGVVQQVVEHANFPILVTRALRLDLRQILLVIDGSPCSQNALEFLVQFPLPVETQIILMHVLPPPSTKQGIIMALAAGADAISPTTQEELERTQKEEEERSENLLAQALEKCNKHNMHVSSLVRRGDAATEILAYTKEYPVDMIVAGSRGLSAISGWLLGSVSRKIVHYAGCSVLIIKGEYCKT